MNGQIPEVLSKLIYLDELYPISLKICETNLKNGRRHLNHNELEGAIPHSFSELSNLKKLYLFSISK